MGKAEPGLIEILHFEGLTRTCARVDILYNKTGFDRKWKISVYHDSELKTTAVGIPVMARYEIEEADTQFISSEIGKFVDLIAHRRDS